MTDDGPGVGEGPRPPNDDERAARLADLLRVDISRRRADPETGDGLEVEEVRTVGDDTPASEPGADETDQPAAAAVVESEAPAELDATEATEEAAASEVAAPAVEARTGSRWSRGRGAVAAVILVVLVLGGAGLAYAGTRIVRSSTAGEVRTPVDDPTAPGFEALVDPTPTLAVLHDVDGLIDAITVLTLPDPDGVGGGVIFVPDRTVTENPLYGESPLEIAYDLGSPSFQAETIGTLLGAAMLEHTVVDAERWTDLVAPVAPLTIDNPNELLVDGEVRFAAGRIELEAADVGPYLQATVDDESDLARLFRHELFWEAWLDAVAEAGAVDAVPGEVDTGIGRFVRALAEGTTEITTLPVQPAPEGSFGETPAFVPRTDQMESLVARLIPFPVSPAPGARARTRVLNGTSDTSLAASVASSLPPAGAEVVFVGNASSFDVEDTTIAYFGDEFRDEAEQMQEILGVGRVVEDERPSDAVDITVTLGADYA